MQNKEAASVGGFAVCVVHQAVVDPEQSLGFRPGNGRYELVEPEKSDFSSKRVIDSQPAAPWRYGPTQ